MQKTAYEMRISDWISDVCSSDLDRLADLDLDLQRVHVDDGTDAGAGEAAAGRQRRDDLARLRGLGRDPTGERRAHDGVVDAVVGDGEPIGGDLGGALPGGQQIGRASLREGGGQSEEISRGDVT